MERTRRAIHFMEGSGQAMISSAQEFVNLSSSNDPAQTWRAAHDYASLETWQEVVERHPEYRFAVAHNKAVPLEILQTLACDEDARVRTMVAMRRKLDEETRESLSRDPDEGVRMAVARNKKVNMRILQSMRNDPWDEIRAVVYDRLR